MGREPEDRYADAGGFAEELSAWLEGDKAREQALQQVQRANAIMAEAKSLERKAIQTRREGDRLASFIEPHEQSDDKLEVWALEDESERLQQQAAGKWVEYVQALRVALNLEPTLTAAHQQLADHFRGRHEEAEAEGNRRGAARYEVLVRSHDRGQHDEYLEGTGRLTLHADAEGATAQLFRFEDQQRRRVAENDRELGELPLDVPLPMGSYLVEIAAPGCKTVRYPVGIQRQEHWHGRPPRRDQTRPIHLPRTSELGADDIYIAPGWTWRGGDTHAVEPHSRQRLWLDGFVMRRFPVTNREYLGYLNLLVQAGTSELAEQHAPREPRQGGGVGLLLWNRDRRGLFLLPEDSVLWAPNKPVVMVSWFAAAAYADWLAQDTGLPWRLPTEMEWEKAARGVDGRAFPSGDFLDPAWACTRGSHRGRPAPSDVDSFGEDISVYGVRGLAGNVEDWCVDRFTLRTLAGDETRVSFNQTEAFQTRGASEQRAARGGHWKGNRRTARSASRNAYDANALSPTLGFRLIRTLDPAAD
jgi:serine/threonine-protein kinase